MVDAGDARATVFAGSSEMATRCRGFDWAATPLGPVQGWSTSLRTMAGAVLASRNPMLLFWGQDLIQFYNDAFRPSLGAADGAAARHPRALGMSARDFWTDVWDTIGPQIDGVMTRGEAVWFENLYLPIERDGAMDDAWWTYSYSPVREADGSIAGTLVVCLETTASVRARRGIETERARAENILDTMSDAHFAFDPDFRIVSANRAMERNVELTRGEMVGRTIWDVFPGLVGTQFERVYRRVIGERVAENYTGAYGDGRLDLVAELSAYPTPDGGAAVFWRDVTARARESSERDRALIEARVARLEAEHARDRTLRLQSLTASLAGARTLDDVAQVVVSDMVGALGARTGALAGVAPERDSLLLLRTVGFDEGTVKEVRRQPLGLQSPLTECFRTRAPVWVESRDGPDGLDTRFPPIAPVWDALGVKAAAFVPLLAGGDVVGVISFAFALPRAFSESERAFLQSLGQQAALAMERARLFDAEHAARQEAEAANRGKSEFLAVMSHELRTPLNAIGGYAELLELGIRGPITSAQRADLGRIQQSQRHLLGLINQVLNYARVETGALEYDIGEVVAAEALAAAEALVVPQVRAKGITYVLGGCDPALRIRADREKLQQILLNLLTNAIKFTDAGGELRVACARAGEMVEMSVTDTGIGIAADKLARVFEPFVQVDQRLTRPHEGVGLGLAISRDLARAMDGDLTAESALGVGSTFRLRLPVA